MRFRSICDAAPTLKQNWIHLLCLLGNGVQAKKICCLNAGLMLVHRLRRWLNFKPPFSQYSMFVGNGCQAMGWHLIHSLWVLSTARVLDAFRISGETRPESWRLQGNTATIQWLMSGPMCNNIGPTVIYCPMLDPQDTLAAGWASICTGLYNPFFRPLLLQQDSYG